MDAPARRRPAPLVVVLFGAAVGLLVGMVWALATPTVYTATAAVFVSTQGVRAVPDLQRQDGFDQQAGDSYAGLATAPIVLEPVARRLGVGTTQLASQVSAGRPADTALIQIRVQDAAPERAALAANAVAERLVAVAPELAPATSRAADVHLTQVLRASTSASMKEDGLTAVLGGLVAGAALAATALLVTWLWRRRPPAGTGLAAPSMS